MGKPKSEAVIYAQEHAHEIRKEYMERGNYNDLRARYGISVNQMDDILAFAPHGKQKIWQSNDGRRVAELASKVGTGNMWK